MRLAASCSMVALTGFVACQQADEVVEVGALDSRLTAAEQVLSVSPSGAGTACTAQEPCTLESARGAVRQLVAAAEGDIAVELSGGEYRLERPLRFDARDSGRNGHRVIWRARADEKPLLSGAQRISDWTLADSSTGLWQAPVPASLRTRQLYIDGVRIPIAQGAPPVALSGDPDGYTAADATYASWRNPDQLELVYVGGAGMWTEPRCRVATVAGKRITMTEPCWSNTTRRAQVTPPALPPWNMPHTTVPTRIENAFELMQPGQFYLDVAQHVLFYRAADGVDPSRADVEAPISEQLLIAEGTLDEPVHDLTFRGLSFAYTTWNMPSTPVGFSEIQANLTITAPLDGPPQGTCEFGIPPGSCPFGAYTSEPAAVSFRAADRVELVRNRFEHLGAAGLMIAYGSHSDRIEGNVFSDISGIGMQLGDSTDPHPEDLMSDARETCTDNRITNNLIHHTGQEYHAAVGIMLFFSQRTTIQYNELHDISYTGISSGALNGHAATPESPDATTNVNADNEISNNLIYRYLTVIGDGGAIYLEGHQNETPRKPDGSIDAASGYEHGLQLVGNVAYHQGVTGNAYYNDIGSQWITWTQNIQWQAWSGHGGCLPVGHIRFTDNYHSDGIADFGCGEPIDVVMAPNTLLSRKPGVDELPSDVLQSAGLQQEFRDLATSGPPLLEYASPAEGPAVADTRVLIAGSGFDANVQVRWGGEPATAVEAVSSSFLIATAPAGVNLALLSVTTERGFASLPINDSDPAIQYRGNWKPDYSPGNYEDGSLHAATLDGSSFTFRFEGTGVEYITDADSDRGATDIQIDGDLYQTVSCISPGWTHQQVCARVSGLSTGPHVLEVIKKSGPVLMLDALRVLP